MPSLRCLNGTLNLPLYVHNAATTASTTATAAVSAAVSAAISAAVSAAETRGRNQLMGVISVRAHKRL